MNIKNYIPFIGMALMLLVVQLIALLLSEPFQANNIKAFSNPQATSNVLWWIAIIIVFTAFILVIVRMNKRWIIQAFILFTVFSTMLYVFFAVFSMVLPVEIDVFLTVNVLLTIALSIALTVLLYKFPEWYIVDITGLIIGAGAASIFGISLAIIPTLLLLVLLAVFDYIAVYRTKHMIALAEGVMDLRLPILLVIPKRWSYSFLTDKFNKEEREAFFMGLGDAVMPTILVISANTFANSASFFGGVNLPALGTMLGIFAGFSILMLFVIKGKPQAGLPFLNGGAILGYVIASLIAGSPIV